jgi:hypothetical protein
VVGGVKVRTTLPLEAAAVAAGRVSVLRQGSRRSVDELGKVNFTEGAITSPGWKEVIKPLDIN